MPKSLWYNVNEKTNFVFTAAEGNFLKKMGFSTVIMNLQDVYKRQFVYRPNTAYQKLLDI